jgi:2-oxoglutarate ferredoxin oxidoreductase subunit delta
MEGPPLEAPDIRRIEQRETESAEPAKKYRIDIFEAWCKSCGICIAFCPRGCLEPSEEGTPLVSGPDLCSGCGWCEIHCPDFAIRVLPRGSARARQDEEAE